MSIAVVEPLEIVEAEDLAAQFDVIVESLHRDIATALNDFTILDDLVRIPLIKKWCARAGILHEKAKEIQALEAAALVAVVRLGGVTELPVSQRKPALWLAGLTPDDIRDIIDDDETGCTMTSLYNRKMYQAKVRQHRQEERKNCGHQMSDWLECRSNARSRADDLLEAFGSCSPDQIVDEYGPTDVDAHPAFRSELCTYLRTKGALASQAPGHEGASYVRVDRASQSQLQEAVYIRWRQLCNDLVRCAEVAEPLHSDRMPLPRQFVNDAEEENVTITHNAAQALANALILQIKQSRSADDIQQAHDRLMDQLAGMSGLDEEAQQ